MKKGQDVQGLQGGDGEAPRGGTELSRHVEGLRLESPSHPPSLGLAPVARGSV